MTAENHAAALGALSVLEQLAADEAVAAEMRRLWLRRARAHVEAALAEANAEARRRPKRPNPHDD